MRKIFLQKSVLYFLGVLLNRGLAFLLLPFLTRYLTPADYGILAVTSPFLMLLTQILMLALDSSIVLFYHQLEELEFRRFLKTLWLFLLTVPLVVIFLLNLFGENYGNLLFASVPWKPYLQITLLTVYLSIIQAIASSLLQAQQKSLQFVLFNFLGGLLLAGFTVYLIAFQHLGVLGNFYAQLISAGIMFIISNILIFRFCQFSLSLEFDWKNLKAALILCLPYLPHGISIWLLNLSDRWILERNVSLDSLGIYNIAYSIGIMVLTLAGSVATAYSPMYFANIKNKDFQQRLPGILTMWALVPTALTLSVSLFSSEILMIMATPAYYPAAAIVPIIAFSYWLYVTLYQPGVTAIEYTRKTYYLLGITVVSAIFNVIMNLIFVPKFGIWAAAVNTLLSSLLMGILSQSIAGKINKIPTPWTRLLVMLVGSIGCFLMGNYVLSATNFWFSVALKSLLMTVTSLLIFYFCGIRVKQIKQMINQLGLGKAGESVS